MLLNLYMRACRSLATAPLWKRATIVRAVSGLLCWCSPCTAGDFDLVYDDGYVDTYDSARSVFTRRICEHEQETVSVPLSLRKEDIRQLKKLVAKIHFFSLEDDINPNHGYTKGEGNGEDIEWISICGGCGEMKLTIATRRESKTVNWRCNCDQPSKDPDELAPLLEGLRKILYSHPAVESLPASNCHFY